MNKWRSVSHAQWQNLIDLENRFKSLVSLIFTFISPHHTFFVALFCQKPSCFFYISIFIHWMGVAMPRATLFVKWFNLWTLRYVDMRDINVYRNYFIYESSAQVSSVRSKCIKVNLPKLIQYTCIWGIAIERPNQIINICAHRVLL